MLRSILLMHSLLVHVLLTSAQQWEKLSTIDLVDIPTAYSVDITGDIYVGFENGNVRQYDHEGNEIINYALPNQSSVSLVEAQNRLKLFVFNFDNQTFTLLDRFSSIPKNYRLAEVGVSLTLMMCPSPDGQYWVIETNPQRLKKIDANQKTVLLEMQTDFSDTITFMRCFRNLLLISDSKGLHVFDQFGSKLYSLSIPFISYFYVKNDLLVCTAKNKLIYIDPFKSKVVKEMDIPSGLQAVIESRNLFAFFEEATMHFYRLIKP